MADNTYNLKFTLSNGQIIDAGTLTAPQGPRGENGVYGPIECAEVKLADFFADYALPFLSDGSTNREEITGDTEAVTAFKTAIGNALKSGALAFTCPISLDGEVCTACDYVYCFTDVVTHDRNGYGTVWTSHVLTRFTFRGEWHAHVSVYYEELTDGGVVLEFITTLYVALRMPLLEAIIPNIGENGNWFLGTTDTNVPARGQNGVTYTPSIDADGNLTWSNDGGLENPPSINLAGGSGTDTSLFPITLTASEGLTPNTSLIVTADCTYEDVYSAAYAGRDFVVTLEYSDGGTAFTNHVMRLDADDDGMLVLSDMFGVSNDGTLADMDRHLVAFASSGLVLVVNNIIPIPYQITTEITQNDDGTYSSSYPFSFLKYCIDQRIPVQAKMVGGDWNNTICKLDFYAEDMISFSHYFTLAQNYYYGGVSASVYDDDYVYCAGCDWPTAVLATFSYDTTANEWKCDYTCDDLCYFHDHGVRIVARVMPRDEDPDMLSELELPLVWNGPSSSNDNSNYISFELTVAAGIDDLYVYAGIAGDNNVRVEIVIAHKSYWIAVAAQDDGSLMTNTTAYDVVDSLAVGSNLLVRIPTGQVVQATLQGYNDDYVDLNIPVIDVDGGTVTHNLLRIYEDGYAEVASVPGSGGSSGSSLPDGGSPGHILRKTESGVEWDTNKLLVEISSTTQDDGTIVYTASHTFADILDAYEVGMVVTVRNPISDTELPIADIDSDGLHAYANMVIDRGPALGLLVVIKSDDTVGVEIIQGFASIDDFVGETGTEGQVLTKTADGSTWSSKYEPLQVTQFTMYSLGLDVIDADEGSVTFSDDVANKILQAFEVGTIRLELTLKIGSKTYTGVTFMFDHPKTLESGLYRSFMVYDGFYYTKDTDAYELRAGVMCLVETEGATPMAVFMVNAFDVSVPAQLSLDDTLLFNDSNQLIVNTTNLVEAGNNLPVTSNAVAQVLGDIEALLSTI